MRIIPVAHYILKLIFQNHVNTMVDLVLSWKNNTVIVYN